MKIVSSAAPPNSRVLISLILIPPLQYQIINRYKNSGLNPGRPCKKGLSSSSSSSVSSASTLPRTRAVDVADNTSADFNFFEEEFQVQLALTISVSSDPDAREDPELFQIKAAKRMSLGCSPIVAADETLDDFLSLRYWNYNVVNYDEKVMDGFYDVYGTSNSSPQGKMPLLVDLQAISASDNVDYGVILVNRSIDPALQQLERTAVSLSMECQPSQRGLIASGLVQKIAVPVNLYTK